MVAGKGREIGYLNAAYMSTSLGTWGTSEILAECVWYGFIFATISRSISPFLD